MKIETDFGKYEHYSSRSILLVNLKPSDIFFESPAHVTLFGNGTLHMFLRGGQQSRLLSFMSIMADVTILFSATPILSAVFQPIK